MALKPKQSQNNIVGTKNKESHSAALIQSYSGVIPPPNFMQGYADVDPSLPDRIMGMAEKNQQHSQEMDKKEYILEFVLNTLGIFTTFVLCLLFIYFGYKLILSDKNGLGFMSMVAGVIPMLATFLKLRKIKNIKKL